MTGLTLRQIGYSVKTYINYDLPAPTVPTVASQLLVGRKAVQKVFDVLRAKEAEVCQEENETGVLSGDVEGDGHVQRCECRGVKSRCAEQAQRATLDWMLRARVDKLRSITRDQLLHSSHRRYITGT